MSDHPYDYDPIAQLRAWLDDAHAAVGRAAVAIHWWELGRQVRAEGDVVALSTEESVEYWKTRPRGSQLAAWASPQSRPLESRSELDALVAEAEEHSQASRFHCRRSGVATASSPRPSSSGCTATTAFTIAFATRAKEVAGSANVWRRSYDGGARAPSVYRPEAFHNR